jgi:hypothetical protein
MKDVDKTKEELIEELVEIRERFRKIESEWAKFSRAME